MNRKDKIKQTIIRKHGPLYGGPDNGRAPLPKNGLGAAAAKKYRRRDRVAQAKAVKSPPKRSGMNYL